MATDPIVIVSAARTPMGAMQGELKDFTAPQLGAAAVRAAVERSGLNAEQKQDDIMGAGGMESMSNAPYLLPKARSGYRLGHQQVIDHMFLDGLEDAYDKGRLMGSFAEACAEKYGFTREEQDKFAIASLERAQAANKNGSFAWEITPLAIKAGKNERFMEQDEQPFKANFEKIPTLKPAFRKDGTVTAANSSCIPAGAAALGMM